MRFLKLASNWLDRREGDPWVKPYWVDVSVSGPEPRVGFSEGVTHDAAGGIFEVREALWPTWRPHLEKADALWLLPYFARMLELLPVTEGDLIAAFRERHGRDPESYETRY